MTDVYPFFYDVFPYSAYGFFLTGFILSAIMIMTRRMTVVNTPPSTP